MSKYQAYPEYKDCGINWIGMVPIDWNIFKVKHLLKAEKGAIKTGPFGSHLKGDDMKGGNVKVINQRNVIYNDFDSGKFYISQKKYEELAGFRIFTDDICITTRGTIGRTAVAPANLEKSILHPCLMRLQIDQKKYVNKLISLIIQDSGYFLEQLKILSNATTIEVIYSESLKNVEIALPKSIEEQSNILKFIDHETAKIDTLIDKQQQLIELLKEKRQAVISHAVTKGLNPQAQMKDSGIEWLGEVPKHWDVCLFKHKCNEVTDGAHISPDLKDGSHYFVSIKDIKNGIINFDNALLTSSKSYDYLVKTGCMPFAGDILFSKDGTIGQTAITPNEIDFVVASSLIIIRPNRQQVVSEYLDFLLQSSLVQEQVESFIKGAALRRLSIQNLLKIFGVFPSLGEQKEIAEYIKKQLKKYSDLMIQANSQVKLLHERRTALISAAVTGKIDVRHFTLEDGIAPTTSSDSNEAQQEATA